MASQTEVELYLKRARLALAQSRDNLKEVVPSLSRELAEDILYDAEQFVDRAADYLGGEGYV